MFEMLPSALFTIEMLNKWSAEFEYRQYYKIYSSKCISILKNTTGTVICGFILNGPIAGISKTDTPTASFFLG